MELSDYQEAGRQLVQKLRLYTDPIAIKFVNDASELPGDAVRPSTLGEKWSLCQAMHYARRHQKHVGITTDENFCTASSVGLGWQPVDNPMETFIESQVIQGWHLDQETEATRLNSILTGIGLENLERVMQMRGFYCAPLAETTVMPDSILIYGMVPQITSIIHALCWEYKYVPASTFEGFGETCIKGGLIPFVTGKPQVVIPGAGDIMFSGATEHEIGLGIPADLVFYVLENLFNTLAKQDNLVGMPMRVKIRPCTADVLPGFAFLQEKIDEYKAKNK